jgi:hypothetical protein
MELPLWARVFSSAGGWKVYNLPDSGEAARKWRGEAKEAIKGFFLADAPQRKSGSH